MDALTGVKDNGSDHQDVIRCAEMIFGKPLVQGDGALFACVSTPTGLGAELCTRSGFEKRPLFRPLQRFLCLLRKSFRCLAEYSRRSDELSASR